MTATTRMSATPFRANVDADPLAAWEDFNSGQQPLGVATHVLESWHRSVENGVDPIRPVLPFELVDLEAPLARSGRAVVRSIMESLNPGPVCVVVTDARGCLLTRWISDPQLRAGLERLSVDVGYVFGESAAGTTGISVALADRKVAVVRGPEHFIQAYHSYTATTAVIHHPIDGRVLGTVSATVEVGHESPLLVTIVGRIAGHIEAEILRAEPHAKRTLLTAFESISLRSVGAVLAISDELSLCNEQARALQIDDRAVWAELVRNPGATSVAVREGVEARVNFIHLNGEPIGAVLAASAEAPRAPSGRAASVRPPARLPSREDVEREIARALSAERSVLLRGEPGTELADLLRRAVGRVSCRDVQVLDLSDLVARPHTSLDDDGLGPAGVIMIEDADALEPASINALRQLLRSARERPVVALLETTPTDGVGSEELMCLVRTASGVRISVPALRERPGDAAAIIAAELSAHLCRADDDVIELMATRDYPGNDAELRQAVRDIAAGVADGVIRREDLPLEVTLCRSGHKLTPLELAERGVIADALRRCPSNKSETARYLGISRTALYAKIAHYRLN